MGPMDVECPTCGAPTGGYCHAEYHPAMAVPIHDARYDASLVDHFQETMDSLACKQAMDNLSSALAMAGALCEAYMAGQVFGARWEPGGGVSLFKPDYWWNGCGRPSRGGGE